jgi:hypothetical protein
VGSLVSANVLLGGPGFATGVRVGCLGILAVGVFFWGGVVVGRRMEVRR